MRVKFKKLHPKAVVPFKSYSKDFCYDVVAVSCTELAPLVYRYGLGFALQIDREGDEELDPNIRLSIDLRPRSSVWKTGMCLSNCEGTIDELYTGEISAVFYHLLPMMPKYEVGDKIGQIKIGFTRDMEFVGVQTLDETERGSNGYGSTGK